MTHSIEMIDGMRVYRGNPPCPETDRVGIVRASNFALQIIEAFPDPGIIAVLNATRAGNKSFIQNARINDITKLMIVALEDNDDANIDRLSLYLTGKSPNVFEEEHCIIELPQSVSENIVTNQPRFEEIIKMPDPIRPVIERWEHTSGIKNETNTEDGRVKWTGVRGIFTDESREMQKVVFIATPRDIP